MSISRKLLALAVAAAAGTVATPALRAADSKPNILFIFADDQCYETIHALGNDEIETPNLDRLARRGTAFTHAYNMGSWSGAVCVASRHMLNTGAFVWKAEQISKNLGGKKNAKGKDGGAGTNPWPNFQEKGWMWSQLMAAAGYDTYFTGKWHVNAPADEVFKVARNIRGGMPKQTPEGYNRPIDGQPDPWSPYDPKFGGFWEGGRHWSEVVADDAEDYLAMAKKSANPFFMYIAFNAAHDPRQSPKEYVDKYPLEKVSLPVNFLPEYPWKDQIDNRKTLRDEALAPFPRTERAVKVNRQEYHAIITHMDAQIGRILDALDSTGQADNTWIFFTADHGLACGHHGLMGKQNLFDHSIRVPYLVAGPGVAADAKNDSPIYLQDTMATALDLAGAEKPAHVQFRSIRPMLAGEPGGYEAVYGGYLKSQRCVVRDGHKLLLYPNVPKALLFDLAADPHEMRDLLEKKGDPEALARASELFADFLKLRADTGDTLELTAEMFPELAGK
ncbi:MAG: sulfatase-like hydrolase/transferase [Akkermansiaceae bacterium]|nr:sulfatase-like hydrolase/transferase [Akkermansiaceae bacterium]